MKRFFITTPIYYINDVPHVGHYYTTLAADVLARYHKLRGEEVIFSTGTDENSQKTVNAAKKIGQDLKSYTDKMAARWRETWEKLGITFTDFIRTTEERHAGAVEKLTKTVLDKNDIYKGHYEGLYCFDCESFKQENELIDGCCADHKKPVKKRSEESYFFKLSRYGDNLLEYYEANPDFLRPESLRNEMIEFIKRGLKDISITRKGAEWGISFPDDPEYKLWVWFDALVNYLTVAGYGDNEKEFVKNWPPDLHLMGKEIFRFHAIIWPAMLMSAGIDLPKRIFGHGFFTINGEKMSKSIGNVVDPVFLSEKYGQDAVRYYLLREVPFGRDGDFSEARLKERYNSDLADNLGNLLSRITKICENNFNGRVPEVDLVKTGKSYEFGGQSFEIGESVISNRWSHWQDYLENKLRFDFLLGIIVGAGKEEGKEITGTCGVLNKYIDGAELWNLVKTDKDKAAVIVYQVLESLRHIAWWLRPILPATSDKIFEQIISDGKARAEELKKNFDEARKWGGLKSRTPVKKGPPLFPKIK